MSQAKLMLERYPGSRAFPTLCVVYLNIIRMKRAAPTFR
jgi:hypothetical protein